VPVILDEPSIGRQQRGQPKLIAKWARLRDLGKNVIVAAHHEEKTMRQAAEHLVEIAGAGGHTEGRSLAKRYGPAPDRGGREGSLTGKFLADERGRSHQPGAQATPSGYIEILGASEHNLRERDRTPHSARRADCVTGVVGCRASRRRQ